MSSIWCERLRRSEHDGAVSTTGEMERSPHKAHEREFLRGTPAAHLASFYQTLTVFSRLVRSRITIPAFARGLLIRTG